MSNPLPVTIIMIEDDLGHARLIEKNIRRAGISNHITHFDNGTAAVEYLFSPDHDPATHGPVLILLDLNLPDMSGTSILSRIKKTPSCTARRWSFDHHGRPGGNSALL
jgi:CheY-like chemotaxis protein